MTTPSSDLRRTYLAWCSSKITGAIVGMTPEEAFRLARAELRRAGGEGDAPEEPSLSYRRAVALLTQSLGRELPDFESWKVEYGKDPSRFHREIESG